MFSGGRDSTVAALRLGSQVVNLSLVTVTSEHLFGIEAVRQRLLELKVLLPTTTRWLHVIEPEPLMGHGHFGAQTCLPCHRSYTVLGIMLAKRLQATDLAYGYAGYQSDWPEQTPEAVTRLAKIVADQSMNLLLPAYDLASKAEAIEILEKNGVTSASLEQKCIRQFTNEALSPETLSAELDAWETSLLDSIGTVAEADLRIVSDVLLPDLTSAT